MIQTSQQPDAMPKEIVTRCDFFATFLIQVSPGMTEFSGLRLRLGHWQPTAANNLRECAPTHFPVPRNATAARLLPQS
jgi:hypothetical protein